MRESQAGLRPVGPVVLVQRRVRRARRRSGLTKARTVESITIRTLSRQKTTR